MASFTTERLVEKDFAKPIDSIMRCEDFKSAFARRLSNRYISKPSLLCYPKVEDSRKKMFIGAILTPEKVVRSFKESVLAMASNNNPDETPKPDDKNQKLSALETENQFLKVQNDTLKWQLEQTEARRKIQAALIQQLVDLMDEAEAENKKREEADEMHHQSRADMPRSLSVHHVNSDYGLLSPVRMNSRQNFRSAGNVSGAYAEWANSKLSLVSEAGPGQNVYQQVSKIIAFAKTLLSTEIPVLVAGGNEEKKDDDGDKKNTIPTINIYNEFNEIIDPEEDGAASNVKLEKFYDANVSYAELVYNEGPRRFLTVPSPLISHFEENNLERFFMQPLFALPRYLAGEYLGAAGRRARRGRNFDNESGFSSMNSLQEIGIPIINVIPPSPTKEQQEAHVEEMEEEYEDVAFFNGQDEEDDDQNMEVFWV